MIAATEAMTVESGKSGGTSTDEKDTHVTKFDDDEESSTVQMMMVKGEETKVRVRSQTPMEKKNPRDDYVILTQLRLRVLSLPSRESDIRKGSC